MIGNTPAMADFVKWWGLGGLSTLGVAIVGWGMVGPANSTATD